MSFFWIGFPLTVLLELPWFLAALPRGSSSVLQRTLLALFANLVSYPWVSLIFPLLIPAYGYEVYLAVAETFAPLSELVWAGLALGCIRPRLVICIVLANLWSWWFGSWLLERGLGAGDL